MKLIGIGFGSMLAAQRILAIMDPDSAPIKRVVAEAKERGMLIDASYGRATKSVILMDTDHVILSALTTETLALGDIGKHFPDTSNEFKGIDSKILLARVMELVRAEGWEVGNVDVTIAMQRPKLAPYIVAMRECMAGVMGISVDRVSVKATTTEKLGFVGRGEGCAVYAVALLSRQA